MPGVWVPDSKPVFRTCADLDVIAEFGRPIGRPQAASAGSWSLGCTVAQVGDSKASEAAQAALRQG